MQPTRAPTANPPNSAQLPLPQVTPGSVQVWACGRGQTHRRVWPQYISRHLRLSRNVIMQCAEIGLLTVDRWSNTQPQWRPTFTSLIWKTTTRSDTKLHSLQRTITKSVNNAHENWTHHHKCNTTEIPTEQSMRYVFRAFRQYMGRGCYRVLTNVRLCVCENLFHFAIRHCTKTVCQVATDLSAITRCVTKFHHHLKRVTFDQICAVTVIAFSTGKISTAFLPVTWLQFGEGIAGRVWLTRRALFTAEKHQHSNHYSLRRTTVLKVTEP